MIPLYAAILDGMSDDQWHAVISQGIDLEDTIEAIFAPVVVDDSIGFDTFDYDEAITELEDARMDEMFWARGEW